MVKKYLSFDDLEIEALKDDRELNKMFLENELDNYLETNDSKYLRHQLKNSIKAFGFCNFEKKSGLSRKTIYNIVNGKTEPRLGNFLKCLRAFGIRIKLC